MTGTLEECAEHLRRHSSRRSNVVSEAVSHVGATLSGGFGLVVDRLYDSRVVEGATVLAVENDLAVNSNQSECVESPFIAVVIDGDGSFRPSSAPMWHRSFERKWSALSQQTTNRGSKVRHLPPVCYDAARTAASAYCSTGSTVIFSEPRFEYLSTLFRQLMVFDDGRINTLRRDDGVPRWRSFYSYVVAPSIPSAFTWFTRLSIRRIRVGFHQIL